MAERKTSLLATIGKRMLGIRTGSGCCSGPPAEAAADPGAGQSEEPRAQDAGGDAAREEAARPGAAAPGSG